MSNFMKNYSHMKLLYLHSKTHRSVVDRFVSHVDNYTSGGTISSHLSTDNCDLIVLDMTNKESLEVLKLSKSLRNDRYIIACTNDPLEIASALEHGADAILLDPLDMGAWDSALFKAASYLNMQSIFHESHYIDELTSCSNVFALNEHISIKQECALVKIALHSYKAFQVYYGTDITNKILVEFGNAIKINLPRNAHLFRSCADEFSILINNPSPSQEDILSSQLKSFFELTPIEVDGFLLKIQTTIGVSTGNDLIQKADIALAEAKEGGCIATYNEDSTFIKEQFEHIEWVKLIQEAISEDRVDVYYQPMLNNKSKQINKYEALCRIKDDKGRVYTPQDFLQPAIVAGRMSDLTRLVIDKSFKYFQHNDHSFSINVTREDFIAEYLEEYISYKCDVYGIEPNRIYIEVLENISTEAAQGFLTQIEGLKALGCNISIDDFGMDSSNFSRMLQIEAEVLKIDGHFIQQLLEDKNAMIIVENIVDFAKKIGAKTVAEYVDSKELFDVVNLLGIDYSQGFYIGKPTPVI